MKDTPSENSKNSGTKKTPYNSHLKSGSYRQVWISQGREDAQMLQEKQKNWNARSDALSVWSEDSGD